MLDTYRPPGQAVTAGVYPTGAKTYLEELYTGAHGTSTTTAATSTAATSSGATSTGPSTGSGMASTSRERNMWERAAAGELPLAEIAAGSLTDQVACILLRANVVPFKAIVSQLRALDLMRSEGSRNPPGTASLPLI